MGASARGFLLFSFAFSSVLSSPEIAVPFNEIQTSTAEVGGVANNNTNVNVAISGCVRDGSCSGSVGGIEKREVSYSQRERDEGRGGILEEKRARVGFTGMRGKKDGYDGADAEGLDEFLDMLEKRSRMMGFNGMRGKRYEEKRMPTAFHGMRGKKSEEYDVDNDGMMDYLTEESPDREYLPEDDGWVKRTMAFHGMRGRRGNSDSDDEPIITKRFPYQMTDRSYDLKRAMGFLGMRGKKTPETWSWGDYKRGVQSGFFGMKGKKAQSGFFGMRGKKTVPGFDGFQGNELSSETRTIKTTAADQSLSTRERVRRGTSWLKNSKKAKNAFFAVRGKKSPSGSEVNLISGN